MENEEECVAEVACGRCEYTVKAFLSNDVLRDGPGYGYIKRACEHAVRAVLSKHKSDNAHWDF